MRYRSLSCFTLGIVLLAIVLGSGHSALASTVFPELEPSASARGFRVSPEERFADRNWQDIEASISRQARITIGHFAGIPIDEDQDRPVRIHYRLYENPAETRGGIVLVPGFTEGLTMYQEVILDFIENGFSVYIHDHRNQGFSTRLLPESPTLGHVDRFDHLVSDLERFLRIVQARRAGHPRPLFVAAHSMGGAVVSLLLQRQAEQTPFQAAALVTPMFEPTVAPPGSASRADRAARRWCDRWAVRLPFQIPGWSDRQVAGVSFDEEYQDFLTQSAHKDNDMSYSMPRLRLRWEARRARCEGEHCGHHDARVAGPTLRWVNQACAASRQARGEAAAAIAIPVLLLNGGEDTIVETSAQAEFCASVNARPPQRCFGYTLAKSRHGLFVEADRVRRPAMQAIMQFFLEAVRNRP